MKKSAIDRWIPKKGRTEEEVEEEEEEDKEEEESPPKKITLGRTKAGVKSKKPTANRKVGGVHSNDEVDDIPIGKLYEPSQKRPRKAAAVQDEEQNTGPVSATLVDLDLLDCPICYEPLSSPVYQCNNGHIACASCCTTALKNKCANCCLPIGNIRCRAIEKILESAIVTCQHRPYGCKEVFSYIKKVGHEKACIYAPCSCPFMDCDYAGLPSSVYYHFGLEHKDSFKQFSFNSLIAISMDTQEHVILREKKEGVLFVVERCIETLGSFYNVVCVAPSASEKRFVYELTATIGEGDGEGEGEGTIKVKMSVEMMSKWTPQPPAKMSLLVPTNLISKTQWLLLFLIIKKIKKP